MDEWKKITKPLEKAKEKPLRFLRYFLMANYVIRNERDDAVSWSSIVSRRFSLAESFIATFPS